MEEGRKRVLAIAGAISAARKLANLAPKPSPTLNLAIADAVEKAERMLQRIDTLWPEPLKADAVQWAERTMRKIDNAFAKKLQRASTCNTS
jgi:hypothetical protein